MAVTTALATAGTIEFDYNFAALASQAGVPDVFQGNFGHGNRVRRQRIRNTSEGKLSFETCAVGFAGAWSTGTGNPVSNRANLNMTGGVGDQHVRERFTGNPTCTPSSERQVVDEYVWNGFGQC